MNRLEKKKPLRAGGRLRGAESPARSNWVGERQPVVQDVAVGVERLQVGDVLEERIGRQEAAE